MPEAYNNRPALGDFAISKTFGLGIFAHHHRDRRIKPFGFAKHIARYLKLANYGKTAAVVQNRSFIGQILLPVRIKRH